jgi:hypothetical protein
MRSTANAPALLYAATPASASARTASASRAPSASASRDASRASSPAPALAHLQSLYGFGGPSHVPVPTPSPSRSASRSASRAPSQPATRASSRAPVSRIPEDAGRAAAENARGRKKAPKNFEAAFAELQDAVGLGSARQASPVKGSI